MNNIVKSLKFKIRNLFSVTNNQAQFSSLIIIILIIPFNIFSIVCPSGPNNICSKAGGLWNDVSVWDVGCDSDSTNDNSIPQPTDNTCISASHNITLNVNTAINDLQVVGILTLGGTSNTLIVSGNITINSGGSLNGGSFGTILDFSGTAFTNQGSWDPGNGSVAWRSNSDIPDLSPGGTADFYDLNVLSSGVVKTPGSSNIVVSNDFSIGVGSTFQIGNGGTPGPANFSVNQTLILNDDSTIELYNGSALQVYRLLKSTPGLSTIRAILGNYSFTVTGEIFISNGSTLIKDTDANGLNVINGQILSLFKVTFERSINPGFGSCHLTFSNSQINSNGILKGHGTIFDGNSDKLVCANDSDGIGDNVVLNFDIDSCPAGQWLNCRFNATGGAKVEFIDGLISAGIITRDETGGLMAGAVVKIYKGTPGNPVLCSGLPGSPSIVAKDGDAFTDIDADQNGKVHIKLQTADLNVPITILTENVGYLPTCDDNNGAGYIFILDADPRFDNCSTPSHHNNGQNCFALFNRFTLKLSKLQRINGHDIGIGDPDLLTEAVVNENNAIISLPKDITTFAKTYDGSGNEVANDVVNTGDGFIVVGSTDIAGNLDFLIAKFDKSGNIIWQKRVGGSGDDEAKFIVEKGDGGYIIAGNTTSSEFGADPQNTQILFVLLDRHGNVQEANTYGGSANEFISVAEDDFNGYVFAGKTNSSGAGGYDIWILKIDFSGNILWQKTYGGSGDENVNQIDTIDNLIIAGETTSFGASETDAWILKVDINNGNIIWEKKIGGAGNDVAKSIVALEDYIGGDIISYNVVGYTNSFSLASDYDFWVLKLGNDSVLTDNDPSNDVIWQKTYGGTGDDIGGGGGHVEELHEGDIILGGYSNSFGSGDFDIWLLRLNSEGMIIKQKRFGNLDDDKVFSGSGDDNEKILILTGISYYSGSPNSNLLVIKLDSELEIYGSCPTGFITDTSVTPQVSDANISPTNAILADLTYSKNPAQLDLTMVNNDITLVSNLICGDTLTKMVNEPISPCSISISDEDNLPRLCPNYVGEQDFIFIPYNPDTPLKEIYILIAGYIRKKIDLSATVFNPTDPTKDVRIAIGDGCIGSDVCTNSFLDTSITIDSIKDEFGFKLGIGLDDTSDKGARTLADNDSLSGVGEGPFISDGDLTYFVNINGKAYLDHSTKKWHVPFVGNFKPPGIGLELGMRVPGYAESSSLIYGDDFYTLTGDSVQRNLKFVPTGEPACSSGSLPSLCFPPLKFAIKLTLKADLGFELQILESFSNFGITPNKNNTFLEIILYYGLSGYTAGETDFNGEVNGVFNPANNSEIGIPLKGFLADCSSYFDSMEFNFVVDGFTLGRYILNPSCDFSQLNDGAIDNFDSVYPKFSITIENVKDNLGKNFKLYDVCSPDYFCNANINSDTMQLIVNTEPGTPYSALSTLWFVEESGISVFHIALAGTKALAEGINIGDGSFGLKIAGFSGISSEAVFTPNFYLNVDAPVEVIFGDSLCNPGPTTVCADAFHYKLIFDKLFVQLTDTFVTDVSSQLPSLLTNNRIGIPAGTNTGLNGNIQIDGNGKLHLPIYKQQGAVSGFVLSLGSGVDFSGSLPFVIDGKTRLFNSINMDISGVFGTSGRVFLNLAPASLCSTGSNIFCTNSSIPMLPVILESFSIITPSAVDLDGTPTYVGFGKDTFTVQFKLTDPSNSTLTGCIPKFSGSILPLSTTITEVDPTDAATTDGKLYTCSFQISFIPPLLNPNLGILKGNLFLSAQIQGGITTSFFDTGKPIAISNNQPELLSGNVLPNSGNPQDSFTFSVIYKDKDNHKPAFVRLYVDINATNSIGNQEVFDMVKEDINCSNFITGCKYVKTLTNIKATRTGSVLFGFGTTDGFINPILKDFKVTLFPANFSQQSCVISNSLSLTINPPSDFSLPTLSVIGIPGFMSNSTFGLVEPNSGTTADNFIFAVKYTSPDNRAPHFVRLGLYFRTWGQRFVNLTKLDSSIASTLPTTLSTVIPATLYNNNFSDGEIYFFRTKLFDKAVFVNGIEADDGIFRIALKGSPDAIVITITDADNDDVDDSLESGLQSDNSKIAVSTYDELPGTSSSRILMNVQPGQGFSGSPKFFAVQCGDLLNGIGDLGSLTPPDSNLRLIQPLLNVKINTAGVPKIKLSVTLPSALPVGGKIFKLLRSKIWSDITNSVDFNIDRTAFTISITDNSEKDMDLGNGIISDPIGIFATTFNSNDGDEIPSGNDTQNNQENNSQFPQFNLPGVGGGCYINPKINDTAQNDLSFLILLLLPLLYLTIRKTYKSMKKI